MTIGDPKAAPDVVIDLYQDWIAILSEFLTARGYQVSPQDEPLQVAIKYHNVLLRSIAPAVREVKRATSLHVPSVHAHAVDEIERKAKAGTDLTPYLSKGLLDLDYFDSLLNDWGLHHMHLGNQVNQSGFVERTGALLFVKVTADTLFMVAVQEHGRWTNKDLLEAILANWPGVLRPFELAGFSSAGPSVSEKDHAKLRAAGVQTMTELSNGKIYSPMGGGYSSARSNMRSVIEHDRFAGHLRAVEAHVREKLQELKQSAQTSGKVFGKPPTFRLGFDNGDPVVVELSSRIGFRYPVTSG